MNHYEMIDAVNEAKTDQEHEAALQRLKGWRIAAEHFGHRLDYCAADLHSMAKYGYDTPMTCGVLHGWEAAP